MLLAVPAAGQPCLGGSPPLPPADDTWLSADVRTEITVLGVNLLTGGLTAGIARWRAGDSFWEAFRTGAMGGAGTYLGKRLVTLDAPGAGVVGRSVAAVGSSVSANGTRGDPAFSRILLPVGPLRLDLRTGDSNRSGIRIDPVGILGLGWAAFGGFGPRLDIGGTLHAGLPVFRAYDWSPGEGWSARNVAGAIVIRGDSEGIAAREDFYRLALAHELVHQLQYDQAFILWMEPLETRLLHDARERHRWMRYLDLSLQAPGALLLNQVIPYDLRPWEWEAHLMVDI